MAMEVENNLSLTNQDLAKIYLALLKRADYLRGQGDDALAREYQELCDIFATWQKSEAIASFAVK